MDNNQMEGVTHQPIAKATEVQTQEQAIADIRSWATDDVYPVPTYDEVNLSRFVLRAHKVDKYEALQSIVKALNRACTVLQDAKNNTNATAKEKDDFYHRAINFKTRLLEMYQDIEDKEDKALQASAKANHNIKAKIPSMTLKTKIDIVEFSDTIGSHIGFHGIPAHGVVPLVKQYITECKSPFKTELEAYINKALTTQNQSGEAILLHEITKYMLTIQQKTHLSLMDTMLFSIARRGRHRDESNHEMLIRAERLYQMVLRQSGIQEGSERRALYNDSFLALCFTILSTQARNDYNIETTKEVGYENYDFDRNWTVMKNCAKKEDTRFESQGGSYGGSQSSDNTNNNGNNDRKRGANNRTDHDTTKKVKFGLDYGPPTADNPSDCPKCKKRVKDRFHENTCETLSREQLIANMNRVEHRAKTAIRTLSKPSQPKKNQKSRRGRRS
eukprot:Pgem_evm1s16633